MTIDSAVLESLIQDGKTLELISDYLRDCCELAISLEELKEIIIGLYKRNLLKVAFPLQYVGVLHLQDSLFREYWFELSDEGEKECIKRNLMCEPQEINKGSFKFH